MTEDFNFDDIDLGVNPSVVEIVKEVLEVARTAVEPYIGEKAKTKPITKEDNENYDKNLAKFMDKKREELKGKVISDGKVVDKTTKETKAAKIEKLKKEIAPIVEARAEQIEAMKIEAIKGDKDAENLKNANIIVIDAQNLDDRKKLVEYFDEGRIVVDQKGKAFILAEQMYPIYNPCKPPIHRVYLHEIIHVTVRSYYLDLVTMPKGSRTLVNKAIWCYHKGYTSHTMITEKQLSDLLDTGTITLKQVFNVHNDVSTGGSYFLGTDSAEPDSKKIEMLEKMELATYAAVNNKSYSSKDIIDEIEDVEIEEEIVDGSVVTTEQNIFEQGA